MPTIEDQSRDFLKNFHLAKRNLEESWQALGLELDEQEQQLQFMVGELGTVLNEKVTWFESRKDHIKSEIEETGKKIKELHEILGTDSKEFDYSNNKRISLIEKLNELNHFYEDLAKEKESKLVLKKEIINEIHEIEDRLGLDNYRCNDALNPTAIAESRKKLNSVKLLMIEKETQQQELIDQIHKLWIDLEVDQDMLTDEFEKSVHIGVENIKLTDECLAKLEEIHVRFLKQKECVRLEVLDLREQIEKIWTRLEPNTENQIVAQYTKDSLKTVHILKAELDNLKQLREERMETFILNVTEKLHELYAETKVAKFSQIDFNCTCDSKMEELTRLEKELDSMYLYKKEVFHMLELVDKLENASSELEELEIQAKDPEIQKNRGGKLFQVLNRKTALLKKLPLYEKKLMDEIKNYESCDEKKFLVNGVQYIVYLQDKDDCKENIPCKTPQKQKNITIKTPSKTPGKTPGRTYAKTPAKQVLKQQQQTPAKTPLAPSISSKALKTPKGSRIPTFSRGLE